MNRARSASECATCRQAPKEDESGRFTCACGILWVRRWGINGTQEEEALLERIGFVVRQDAQGDVCYDMPEGAHIIHLYADGTWESDKAGAEQSLGAYLTWIREKRTALQAALGERS